VPDGRDRGFFFRREEPDLVVARLRFTMGDDVPRANLFAVDHAVTEAVGLRISDIGTMRLQSKSSSWPLMTSRNAAI
jgi:hypothetical protein